MTKLNRARCRKCGDIIESTYRHDWVACKCGGIFIDGGNAYRRGGCLKEGFTFDDIEYLDENGEVER